MQAAKATNQVESKIKKEELKIKLKDVAVQGCYLFLSGFVMAAGGSTFGMIKNRFYRNSLGGNNVVPFKKTA